MKKIEFICTDCGSRRVDSHSFADGLACPVCRSHSMKRHMAVKRELFLITELERIRMERVLLLKRLRHLLQSKTIAEYDAVNPATGEYVKDITLFDEEKTKCHSAEHRVLYLCDKRACDVCHGDTCQHTSDIRHAVHFVNEFGNFVEYPG